MAAFHAKPQMHPGVTDLDAVFANVDLGVRDLDLIEMLAGCCHKFLYAGQRSRDFRSHLAHTAAAS